MAWAGWMIGALAPTAAFALTQSVDYDAVHSLEQAAPDAGSVQFEDSLHRLGNRLPFSSTPDAALGAPLELTETSQLGIDHARMQQQAWYTSNGVTDRLRIVTTGELRRSDGSLLPPTAMDPVAFSGKSYDVTYTRGWTAAKGRTPSGLEVTLTPHAGLGVGSDGPSAEAGATLRIGENLDRVAPNGDAAFGQRARWYLYAAGSKRAVGYNFARTRDGEFAGSGISQDSGAYLGDASVGVAYRRGAIQSSVGVVYREIEAKGLRGYQGITTDVKEGLIAFQLTIRAPRR